MFKTLWNWIWDIDDVRSKDILKTSISGKALVEFRSSFGGWSLRQTDHGVKGSYICTTVSQIGNNIETIKQVLRREYDDYLSPDDYNELARVIRDRLSDGGYYLDTLRNKQGTVDFIRAYWSAEDKKEIQQLINSWTDIPKNESKRRA